MNLAELLKNSSYWLTQFKPEQFAAFEADITQKYTGKTHALYANCQVRGRPIKLTHKEAARWLDVMALKDDLGLAYLSPEGALV